jgi:hypothetical protein
MHSYALRPKGDTHGNGKQTSSSNGPLNAMRSSIATQSASIFDALTTCAQRVNSDVL